MKTSKIVVKTTASWLKRNGEHKKFQDNNSILVNKNFT
jgi:ribosomal protein L14